MSTIVSNQPTTIADVAEQLMSEYQRLLPASVVADVVLQARKDLHGQTPDGAFPEMLFRLAQARLSQMIYAISC